MSLRCQPPVTIASLGRIARTQSTDWGYCCRRSVVCVSVCLSADHDREPYKRLNRSRCRLGCGILGPRICPREGAIWGRVILEYSRLRKNRLHQVRLEDWKTADKMADEKLTHAITEKYSAVWQKTNISSTLTWNDDMINNCWNLVRNMFHTASRRRSIFRLLLHSNLHTETHRHTWPQLALMLTDVDKFIIDVQPSLIHVSHVSHFSVILQTSCKSNNTLTTVYAVTFALFC